MEGECPCAPIEISSDREIVDCSNLDFEWKQDPKGYFLVRIENGEICCGFCTNDHRMVLELRSSDADNIIKEIVKRDLCNKSNLGYVASELVIASNCLQNELDYVQR
jgi:hypothetical protein